MSKFTPGDNWYKENRSVVTDELIICEVADCDASGKEWMWGEKSMAFQNLISAAPDMYEALVKVNASGDWDYLDGETQEAVILALAKADSK